MRKKKREAERQKKPLCFLRSMGSYRARGEGDELQPIRDNLRASEGVFEGVEGGNIGSLRVGWNDAKIV